MNTLRLNTEAARQKLLRFVQNVTLDRDLEFRWRKWHRDRTLEQNALSHVVYKIAGEQLNMTPEEVRCEMKLRYGVPILRAADPDYCAAYDKAIKPHPYETKLEMMRFWPVTRLMTSPQMTEYVDTIQRELAMRGVFFDHERAA